MGEEQAEALKMEANKLFAEHKYAKAVVVYSKSLDLSPTNVKVLSNRAFAHLKLENYGSAVEDSSKAIELDPAFIKVRHRPKLFVPHARTRTKGTIAKCGRLLFRTLAHTSLPFSFLSNDVQAYYRRGSSHFALGHFSEALKDFRKVPLGCARTLLHLLCVAINTALETTLSEHHANARSLV